MSSPVEADAVTVPQIFRAFLLIGDADLDHQNPTSRSISARTLSTLGTAHSSNFG